MYFPLGPLMFFLHLFAGSLWVLSGLYSMYGEHLSFIAFFQISLSILSSLLIHCNYDSILRSLVLLVHLPPRRHVVTDHDDGYGFLCFASRQVSPLCDWGGWFLWLSLLCRTTFPTDLGVMVTALGNNARESCSSYPKFSRSSWIATEKVALRKDMKEVRNYFM